MPSAVCFLLAAFCVFVLLAMAVCRQEFLAVLLGCAAMVLVLQGVEKATVQEPLQSLPDEMQTVRLRVDEIYDGFQPQTKRVYATVLQAETDALPGIKIQAIVEAPIEIDDILEGEASFSALPQDEFRAGQYADGVYLNAEGESLTVCGNEITLQGRMRLLREQMASRIKRYLRQDLGAIAAATAVGDTFALSDETREVFRKAGFSHILVVSGMHLSVWCGVWLAIGERLKNRRLAALLACVGGIGFALVTGFSPSMVRALTGMLVYCGCQACFRKSDGLNSLGLAMFVLICSNPFVCLDPAFLLSVSATGGVLYAQLAVGRTTVYRKKALGKDLSRREQIVLSLLYTIAVPFFASVATIPVLIYLGSEIALYSVAANLLASLLLLPQLIFGWLCLATAWAFPASAMHRLFSFCVALSSQALLSLAEFFAELPYSAILLKGGFALCLCGLFAAAWLVLWRMRRSLLMLVLVPLCVMISLVFQHFLLGSCVTLVMVGSSTNPVVIAFDNAQAVVLFRGGSSNQTAVEEFLKQHHLRLEWVWDMRQDAATQITLDAEHFGQSQALAPEGMRFEALNGKLTGAIFPQKDAAMAVLSAYGITAAIPYGDGYWKEFPQTSLLMLAGGKREEFLSARWILTTKADETSQWMNVISGEAPAVRIWPGGAIRLERNLS